MNDADADDPFDLEDEYGSDYRVHKCPRSGQRLLRGAHGKSTIHALDQDSMCVECNGGHKGLIAKLRALGDDVQDYQAEPAAERVSLKFPRKMFDQVAALVGAHRRRKLSEAQRGLLERAGSNYRFGSSKPLPVPDADEDDD